MDGDQLNSPVVNPGQTPDFGNSILDAFNKMSANEEAVASPVTEAELKQPKKEAAPVQNKKPAAEPAKSRAEKDIELMFVSKQKAEETPAADQTRISPRRSSPRRLLRRSARSRRRRRLWPSSLRISRRPRPRPLLRITRPSSRLSTRSAKLFPSVCVFSTSSVILSSSRSTRAASTACSIRSRTWSAPMATGLFRF